MEASEGEALRETLDQLRLEVGELRASRERIVVSADADRRRLERLLHDGVQQHLIALAVDIQLASRLAEDGPAEAKTVLEEMALEVQQAIDESAALAQQIYPPLLEAGGLGAALRSAALAAGTSVSIDVAAGASYPPEVAGTVYFCCLDALERAGAGATITVRDEEGALIFEVAAHGTSTHTRFSAGLDLARDRLEALGGTLTTRREHGGTSRVSGWLPLSR